jgi:hypothetical protein
LPKSGSSIGESLFRTTRVVDAALIDIDSKYLAEEVRKLRRYDK